MKTCRKGHLHDKDRCPECSRQAARRWRDKNIELSRLRDRERYADPSKRRREHAREASQRWRERHPEESKAKSLANKWSHIDAVRARSRRYQSANRGPYAEAQRRRRARKLSAFVDIVTEHALAAITRTQHGRCYYCSKQLTADRHLEHKTPLVRGGAHALVNLCWSCPSCNRRKGTKTETEFRDWLAVRAAAVKRAS